MKHYFSGSNRASEKCTPIFPDGIFQMRIRVPFCCTHLWDQIQAFETCFSVEWTDLLHIGLTQYQSGILPVLNGTQHGCPFGSWRSQYGYPLSESWPVNKGGNEHLGLVGAKFQKMLSNFGWLLESFRGKFGAIFFILFIGQILSVIELAPGALIQSCKVALKSGLSDRHVWW